MSKKPVLSVLSPEAREELLVPVAAVDTLLPCRQFVVEHKVTALGKVALTTEFLLRLLRASEGMQEVDIGAFFGFSHRELAFVLREVEQLGFVERGDGKAWITPQGSALFREGAANPEIFEVEKRRETHGFDLLSMAPQRWMSVNGFERRLPELKFADPKYVSRGAEEAPQAFRKFFRELSRERDKGFNRRSLYSVDRVTPGERFMSLVEVTVSVSNSQPAQAQTDLSAWRHDEAELEDRPEIRAAAANLVRAFEAPSKPDDAIAYESLVAAAPDALKEYTLRGGGLSVERYFREAAARAGEVRADRPTAAIVGSLFLRKNLTTWFDVISYGAQDQAPVNAIVWLTPAVACWGASTRLPDVLRELKQKFSGVDEEPPPTVAIVQSWSEERQLEHAFDHVAVLSQRPTPAALECLLIPNVACAVLVHAPIRGNHGFPVPLGVMSFDPAVVSRAREIIEASAAGLGATAQDLLDLLS